MLKCILLKDWGEKIHRLLDKLIESKNRIVLASVSRFASVKQEPHFNSWEHGFNEFGCDTFLFLKSQDNVYSKIWHNKLYLNERLFEPRCHSFHWSVWPPMLWPVPMSNKPLLFHCSSTAKKEITILSPERDPPLKTAPLIFMKAILRKNCHSQDFLLNISTNTSITCKFLCFL